MCWNCGAGCHEQPVLEARTVGKMGLKGVPGLRIGTPAGSAPGGRGAPKIFKHLLCEDCDRHVCGILYMLITAGLDRARPASHVSGLGLACK